MGKNNIRKAYYDVTEIIVGFCLNVEMRDEIETSVISVAEENKNTLQETISVIDEKIKNMMEIQSMQAEIRERNNKLYLGLFSLGIINCLGIFAIILIFYNDSDMLIDEYRTLLYFTKITREFFIYSLISN